MAPDNDYELIQACRRGDVRAWDKVLEKYERLVFFIAYKYGLSRDEAADVTQTTFTILMQSLETLREDTRLAPWLATVAKRHTWRWLARRKREQVHPVEDLAAQDWAKGSTFDPFDAWERVEWLREGLKQLDQRCRERLQMLYFEAKTPSYTEVAERFNMAQGSVGPTRARCLERLKELMVETVRV